MALPQPQQFNLRLRRRYLYQSIRYDREVPPNENNGKRRYILFCEACHCDIRAPYRWGGYAKSRHADTVKHQENHHAWYLAQVQRHQRELQQQQQQQQQREERQEPPPEEPLQPLEREEPVSQPQPEEHQNLQRE